MLKIGNILLLVFPQLALLKIVRDPCLVSHETRVSFEYSFERDDMCVKPFLWKLIVIIIFWYIGISCEGNVISRQIFFHIYSRTS